MNLILIMMSILQGSCTIVKYHEMLVWIEEHYDTEDELVEPYVLALKKMIVDQAEYIAE